MTYSQLLSDLAALNVHPLTDTNVHAVACERDGAVTLDFDGSELREAKADLEKLQTDYDELESRQEHLEIQKDALETILDEIKSEAPADRGCTLRQALKRAEQAEAQARQWREQAQIGQELVETLRKRKGVSVGYLREKNAILRILGVLMRYSDDPVSLSRIVTDAKITLSRIHS
jgi:multidrug efflux pump subunit AcrA (membrane-fusion protein)